MLEKKEVDQVGFNVHYKEMIVTLFVLITKMIVMIM